MRKKREKKRERQRESRECVCVVGTSQLRNGSVFVCNVCIVYMRLSFVRFNLIFDSLSCGGWHEFSQLAIQRFRDYN